MAGKHRTRNLDAVQWAVLRQLHEAGVPVTDIAAKVGQQEKYVRDKLARLSRRPRRESEALLAEAVRREYARARALILSGQGEEGGRCLRALRGLAMAFNARETVMMEVLGGQAACADEAMEARPGDEENEIGTLRQTVRNRLIRAALARGDADADQFAEEAGSEPDLP